MFPATRMVAPNHPCCKGARCLDVGRIVHEGQGLLGRIRRGPAGRTFLSRRGVEGEHAWMQEGALPEGVQTPTVLPDAISSDVNFRFSCVDC